MKQKTNTISALFTVLIIISIFYFGAVDAVDVFVRLNDSSVLENSDVTFIASVDINVNEHIPIENLTLRIGTSTCTFSPSGTEITGSLCSAISLKLLSQAQYGYGYGYGYGYDENHQKNIHYYGYGYGYGDTSQNGTTYPYGDISYEITWTTPDVTSTQDFNITLQVNTPDGSYATEDVASLKVRAVTITHESGNGHDKPAYAHDEYLHTFIQLTPGEYETLIQNPNIAVNSILFRISDYQQGYTLRIKQLPSVPIEPLSGVYQYLEVSFTDDYDYLNMTFRVPKSWVSSTEKDSVVLMRYHNGWQVLNTTLIDEIGDSYTYTASVPGFSYFAIARRPVKEDQIVDQFGGNQLPVDIDNTPDFIIQEHDNESAIIAQNNNEVTMLIILVVLALIVAILMMYMALP